MSDQPPVVRLSDKRRAGLGVKAVRFTESNLRSVSEYFRDVVEPRIREEAAEKLPKVNLGYPQMKKRRG